MEHFTTWAAIFIPIICVFIAWVFNNIITKRSDAQAAAIKTLEDSSRIDKELYFRRLDDMKKEIEEHYVRKDIYIQAIEFGEKNTDEKFRSLLHINNTQFTNIENTIKNINEQLSELKKYLNDKFNGHKS